MARSVCLPWQRFSIPHSSVIFSTVTSGNPPSKEALSLSCSLSLLSCHLLTFLFLSLPSSRSLTPPCFFSYVDMENHLSIPSLSLTAILPFFCQRSLDEAAFSQLQILAAVSENIQDFTMSQSLIYQYNTYFSFF